MKKYIVVRPAFTWEGDEGDLAVCFVSPFHKFYYERVCGYSLGHEPRFYDSLDDAKWFVSSSQRRIQSAVVELEFDNESGRFTKFNKIFTSKYYRPEGSIFFGGLSDKWEKKDINPRDFSEGALEKINQYYQSTIISPSEPLCILL